MCLSVPTEPNNHGSIYARVVGKFDELDYHALIQQVEECQKVLMENPDYATWTVYTEVSDSDNHCRPVLSRLKDDISSGNIDTVIVNFKSAISFDSVVVDSFIEFCKSNQATIIFVNEKEEHY